MGYIQIESGFFFIFFQISPSHYGYPKVGTRVLGICHTTKNDYLQVRRMIIIIFLFGGKTEWDILVSKKVYIFVV